MVLLSEIASLLGVTFVGTDVCIQGFSTDTRSLCPGDLFIALSGQVYDGHDYLAQAQAGGAAAALVSRAINTTTTMPLLRVPDTQASLSHLATAWRQRFSLPVVAITGSCGKTSTRALLQSILSLAGKTLASQRSYNNHIGVPLTLLALRESHQYAVLEVGTNHPGEIAPLVNQVKPHIAILTNVNATHLAGFGSVAAIAREKAQIFSTLAADDIAIVNADDGFADDCLSFSKAKSVLRFAVSEPADVSASDINIDAKGFSHFRLHTPVGETVVQLPLLGKHHVYNALAASAAAVALRVPLEKIKQGLQTIQAESQRLSRSRGYAQACIIDDSYNASPASVQAAIAVLAQHSGDSILVLGDMLELGEQSAYYHRQIGIDARASGINQVFCYGEQSRLTAQTFGDQGYYFSQQQALLDTLRARLHENVTVLVKGSRGMKMELIAQSLLQR